MANKFDRIIQENFSGLTIPLVYRICDLKNAEIICLDRKIQRTLEREMDTLLQVVFTNEHKGLLDVEWQVTNDPKMNYRMLLYHAISSVVYDLPVLGLVIYIGKEQLNMPAKIDTENLKYNYTLIDFTELNPSVFLESDIPEEVIMAILAGNPDFRQKREIIKKILHKLQLLLRHDKAELDRRIGQLEIIGELRNSQKIIIEEEKIMAITYNIEKDIRYNQGLEKGIEQGIKKGLEKGKSLAIKERNTAIITSLLQNTSHSAEEIAKLVNVPLKFVVDIQQSLGSRR